MFRKTEVESSSPIIPFYQPEINGQRLFWNVTGLARFAKLSGLSTYIYILEAHQKFGQPPSERVLLTIDEDIKSEQLLQTAFPPGVLSKEEKISRRLLEDVPGFNKPAFTQIDTDIKSGQAIISVNEAEILKYGQIYQAANPDQGFLDILNSSIRKDLLQIAFQEKRFMVGKNLACFGKDCGWLALLTCSTTASAAGMYLSWEMISLFPDMFRNTPVLTYSGLALAACLGTVSLVGEVGSLFCGGYLARDILIRPEENITTYPGKVAKALNDYRNLLAGCVYLHTSGRKLLSF